MKFHGKLVIGAMIISLLAGCNYNNISESISNIINSNTQSESQNNNNESNSTNTSSVTNNSSSINNSSNKEFESNFLLYDLEGLPKKLFHKKLSTSRCQR